MATRKDSWDGDVIDAPIESFQVTQVIGTIELNQYGDMTPHEAAFKLIGSFGDPGTFTFPLMAGGTCTVHVEFTHPKENR